MTSLSCRRSASIGSFLCPRAAGRWPLGTVAYRKSGTEVSLTVEKVLVTFCGRSSTEKLSKVNAAQELLQHIIILSAGIYYL